MAMGRSRTEKESVLWVATSNLVISPSHPFHERLKAVLRWAGPFA